MPSNGLPTDVMFFRATRPGHVFWTCCHVIMELLGFVSCLTRERVKVLRENPLVTDADPWGSTVVHSSCNDMVMICHLLLLWCRPSGNRLSQIRHDACLCRVIWLRAVDICIPIGLANISLSPVSWAISV